MCKCVCVCVCVFVCVRVCGVSGGGGHWVGERFRKAEGGICYKYLGASIGIISVCIYW